MAAAAAAQPTPRGLVDPGRCRLRAGRRSRCDHPRHGRADDDAGPYTDAAAAGQALIAAQFATVLHVVWRSIWQFLDAILLAAWWLGIGWLLRQDHLRLSRLSLALAAAAAAGGAVVEGLKNRRNQTKSLTRLATRSSVQLVQTA